MSFRFWLIDRIGSLRGRDAAAPVASDPETREENVGTKEVDTES